jgi:hypothetical protein
VTASSVGLWCKSPFDTEQSFDSDARQRVGHPSGRGDYRAPHAGRYRAGRATPGAESYPLLMARFLRGLGNDQHASIAESVRSLLTPDRRVRITADRRYLTGAHRRTRHRTALRVRRRIAVASNRFGVQHDPATFRPGGRPARPRRRHRARSEISRFVDLSMSRNGWRLRPLMRTPTS